MPGHELSVELLGPVRAHLAGCELDLGPTRQRALFAVLALRANEAVSRQELIAAVWGANAPATVTSSVHTYVYRLRRALELSAPRESSSPLASVGRAGYRLRLDPAQVDVRRFETHLERGRRLRPAEALTESIEELDSALALWRGEALEGLSAPVAELERPRFEELRFSALETRVANLLDLGFYSEAICELTGLVRKYPLREGLRGLLITAYSRSGRRAEALAEFQRLRERLIDELGVEPNQELQRQHMLILRGMSSPGPVHHAVALGTGDPDNRAQGGEDGPESAPSRREAGVHGFGATPAQLPRDVPAFVGRRREAESIRALASLTRSEGESAVILLTGCPGSGKSALAVHSAHELARHFPDGQLYVDLEGFSAAKPMTPLQAIQTLLTGLCGHTLLPRSLKECSGLYRSMTAGRRMLIVLDNAASEEQVRALLPGSSSCLVLVTSRNNLRGLVAHDGARRVEVGAMSEDDAALLAQEMLTRQGATASAELSSRLADCCERLPAAVCIAAEYVGARAPYAPPECLSGGDRGDLLDRLSSGSDRRSSLRSILSWSLAPLSEQAETVFRALGAHPTARVDLRTVSALARMDHRSARRCMDELVDANLVRRDHPDGFAMSGLVHAYARQSARD